MSTPARRKVDGMGAVITLQILSGMQDAAQNSAVRRSLKTLNSSVDATREAVERLEATNDTLVKLNARQVDIQEEQLAVLKRGEKRDILRDERMMAEAEVGRTLKQAVFDLRQKVREFDSLGDALASFILLKGLDNLAETLRGSFGALHEIQDKEYLRETLDELDISVDAAASALNDADIAALAELQAILTKEAEIPATTEDVVIEEAVYKRHPKPFRLFWRSMSVLFLLFIVIMFLPSYDQPDAEPSGLDILVVLGFVSALATACIGLILGLVRTFRKRPSGEMVSRVETRSLDVDIKKHMRRHWQSVRKRVDEWLRRHEPLDDYITADAFVEPLLAGRTASYDL